MSGWVPDNDRVVLGLWVLVAVMLIVGLTLIVVGGRRLARLYREEDQRHAREVLAAFREDDE